MLGLDLYQHAFLTVARMRRDEHVMHTGRTAAT